MIGRYRITFWSLVNDTTITMGRAFTEKGAYRKAKRVMQAHGGRAVFVYRGARCLGMV